MSQTDYDVVIVGAGIAGSALLFTLSRYTDIKSVALLDKEDGIARLNSNALSNSQTLHCGDIETNYSLEKAIKVKQIANMIVRYGDLLGDGRDYLHTFPKMVIGVGEQEVEFVRQRHQEFSQAFPYMTLWDKQKVATIEPDLVVNKGELRPEPFIASGATEEVCAVDYGKLAESFVKHAHDGHAQVNVHLSTRVKRITRTENGFRLHTNQGEFNSRFVAVNAGAHSLLFAHDMDYGREFSLLPVAGSFFYIKRKFNSKVYTVQNGKLPFAAIHADPDIARPDMARLGPTALILPKLERYRPGNLAEFLRAARPDHKVAKVLLDMFADHDIRNYIIRNILFDVPFIRERLYIRDARKIIPSLKREELKFAKGVGGVRPQVIDRKARKLQLGEALINPGDGILFNITPSPGATTCLGSAFENARTIADYLGNALDEDRLKKELL